MARPTVSVIIPAYRAEKTIARALRSVYAQSSHPDEVIVVDDGSPDGTAALVEREFPLVRLLRQANAGPAKARNAAAEAASGEWLAFLDADDTWLPEKLERQLQMAGDPDLTIIGTRLFGRRKEPFDPKPDFDALWRRNTISTSTALVRRSAYVQAGGMPTALRQCEDYHLWLRLCAEGGRIAICDEALAVYAPPGDSLTHQRVRFAEGERVCIEDIASRYDVPEDRVRQRLADGYRAHARGAIAFRDMKAARLLLWRSLRYRITAAQLIELLAAMTPAFLLDLRRALVARRANNTSSVANDTSPRFAASSTRPSDKGTVH